MDPLTHSLAGAALARAGLERATPLATLTLVLAANAPDIDAVVALRGSYASLALRRGVTHGPLALLVLPVLVTAVVLFLDRRRRRRDPAAAPARAGPVLLLALLGVLTHAPLDWLNTYGVRLLSPFAGRWFYGDALFIIDPWLWLLLALAVVPHAKSGRARIGWAVAAVAATVLMLVGPVANPARIAWVIGVSVIVAAARIVARRDAPSRAVLARAGLAAGATYIACMIAADTGSRRDVLHAVRTRAAATVEDVMVAPLPANPFAGDIVVRTPDAYRLGRHEWLRRPRVRWTDSIPVGPRNDVVLATLRLEPVRDFLRWSRYPYVRVVADDSGHVVTWGDARYPARMGGGLSGITVRVDLTPQARVP